jgi:subtilisin family serine protease
LLAVATATIVALGVPAGVSGAMGSSKFQLAASQPHQIGAAIQTPKSRSGRMAKSDRSLFRLQGTKQVPVVIKLDYDPIASYTGTVSGYAATSPSTTHRSLAHNAAAVAAYTRYVASYESQVRSGIAARIPGAKITQSFQKAYGGISALVPANQISQLLKVPGVAAVQKDALLQPLDNQQTADFLGAPIVWKHLGGRDDAGSNVLVANIDTGVWPENPMFRDKGLPAPPGTYGCEFGDGTDPDLGDPFTCNNKLVGAYAFTDTYLIATGAGPDEFCDQAAGVCSARDSDGHGTHTLSTAAGDSVKSAPVEGIERGPATGLAPGAHVIAYRVCLAAGCYQSDSVAAVNQAITDGVNVLNFSVSGGADPYSDPVELAFLDAYSAGIQVNASAGNAGPGAATSDHGGAWVNTIAASTPPYYYLSTLKLTADNGDKASFTGSEITPGIDSATDVVMAADIAGYNDPLCGTPIPTGTSADGAVVVCERGNPAGRAADSFNVLQGGGAGMILYNPVHQDLFSDNFWVPTIMLDGGPYAGVPAPTTDAFLDYMSSHTGVTATWDPGTLQPVTADVITTFSSRGPVGPWLKPNVTAPGIEILAGTTPQSVDVATGPPGNLFMAIAGTSMSSPHAAGVAALVKAAHPDWTPGQITSALMTSSVQDVLDSDGSTPANPFATGAGSIRANRAVNPTLTFDVSPTDFADAATDPLHQVDLNLPSVDATTMPGLFVTTRSATNVTSKPQQFTAVTTSTGGTISVSPSTFVVGPGVTKDIHITIHGEDLADGQYFGQITLQPTRDGVTPVVLPVAFDRTQGAVAVTNDCSPTTIDVGDAATCNVSVTNNSPIESDTSALVRAPGGLKLKWVSGSDDVSSFSKGFSWSGTLSPSIAPSINSITPGGSPNGSYLALSDLGVQPIAGMGDETITNFGVPSFEYGHESYSTVGVDSNGYVVVGGGTSQDNDCCTIQTLPDSAPPNNIVAPFWTDLDASQATGGVYIAVLGDGINNWTVVDWEGVPTFGTTEYQNFEVWLLADGDSVTYAMGDLTGPGADTGLGGGAENRDGSSGVNLIADANQDYTVNDGSPTPGGSFTATYTARGKAAGEFPIGVSVDSDQVRGTTRVQTDITVNP